MNIYGKEVDTFKDIIDLVDANSVKDSFTRLYPKYAKNVDAYLRVLESLKKMKPSKERDNFIIAVDWCPPDEEFGDPGYYRVHGYHDNYDNFMGLEYMEWTFWLSKIPDKRFLMNYPMEDYIAHCLWEMTWCGFSENSIREGIKDLVEREIAGEAEFLTWEELAEDLNNE
jgi:hypothetical protein